MPQEQTPSIERVREESGAPQPEHVPAPEQHIELPPRPQQNAAELRAAEASLLPQQPQSSRAPSRPKQAVSLQEIESVLSRDLEAMYFQMTPDTQAAFKKKGEEAAQAIKTMFDSAKVNVKKISRLIMDWLKMIPGVNRYFLEQESKIKTDEILSLNAR